MKRLFKYVGRR